MNQTITYTNNVAQAVNAAITRLMPSAVFILSDTNTRSIAEGLGVENAVHVTVPAGDSEKTIEHVALVWKALTDASASRKAVLINVGGGMVTDLGGFAAATYKRGIRFINVPTTLLGAVDAAVGGKTGVNFGGFKNQVGAFAPADEVIISSVFFKSLPETELLSGYAEMLKHGLLTSPEETRRLLNVEVRDADVDELLDLLRISVKVKEDIVAQDPTEKGIRKALNLGHTIGHAFEEHAFRKNAPIPHGYAVAWGLVVEAILSKLLAGFGSEYLNPLVAFVKENYNPCSPKGPRLDISCEDYDGLLALMAQDKKNPDPEHIIFTLLRAPGDLLIDSVVSPTDIKTALDISRDLLF